MGRDDRVAFPHALTAAARRFARRHFFAYAGLMFLFAQLYARRLYFALGFIAMGIALEFLQGASGYRSYDSLDMMANALGVLAGWGAALILRLRIS